MIRDLLALLMFVAGVAISFTIQFKAGVRPTFDASKWKPVWSNPAFNRKPLFWIGESLWVAGVVMMLVTH